MGSAPIDHADHARLPAQSVARPPQFVLLAFDNCQENQTWKEVTEFLQDMNSSDRNRLRFTFFLSGVALLKHDARAAYTEPTGRKGVSRINFGGTEAELLERISRINKLYKDGNEIASHAVGHFDGGKWTTEMWRHEFDQYNRILNNVADVNGLQGEARKRARLEFGPRDMLGFRAPYLAGGANLLRTLMSFGFAYDTSDTNQGWEPTTWPRRSVVDGKAGPWNFGLGFIPVPGLTTKIPAMDYNFCYRQGGGCPEKYPDALNRAESDSSDMLTAYYNYFLLNYNGNRAPVHIGHHFQPYRGGAYNRALKRFARTVCSLPEVRCVTYQTLTKYMNELPTGARDAFQSNKFPRSTYRPTLQDLYDRTEWPRALPN